MREKVSSPPRSPHPLRRPISSPRVDTLAPGIKGISTSYTPTQRTHGNRSQNRQQSQHAVDNPHGLQRDPERLPRCRLKRRRQGLERLGSRVVDAR